MIKFEEEQMMRQLKKLMAFALVVCMMFTMAACGKKGGETSNNNANTTDAEKKTESESTDGIVVGYLAKNTVDSFHTVLNKAAEEKLDAFKANGTIKDWYFFDGKTDPKNQCNLLDEAFNKGCNLIILLPAEAEGCSPILERCQEKNVPIIVVNSKTDNTDQLATTFVGSNDVEAGEIMAKFVKQQLPEGGGYAHIQGSIGNSAQIQRGQGIHNILDADSNWTLLDGCEQTADWQSDKAVALAEEWLAQYGDGLNAIICDNDDMSSAVQAAMNAAGRSDIICIGVDGSEGPLTMIKNGEMLATVYQDGSNQVIKGIELGIAVAKGQLIEKTYTIPFVLITKDNVDNYLK